MYSMSKRRTEAGGIRHEPPLQPAPRSPYASSGGILNVRFPPEERNQIKTAD
jgi:hypothetical protein